ncbi:alpha/beta hydrolase fold domain-containing protein, partial [Acinetobacter baumannii]
MTRAGGGDTMETLEWIDGNLVSYNGYISHSARAYVGDHSMSDPFISPLLGDFEGFPPAVLTSGTRDLFLSLTCMTHRKLRQAGVV